jgi:hypothetical protein
MVFHRGLVTALARLAVGIPLTLLAAAALAIYIPARRAMRIDPIPAVPTTWRSLP